MTKARWSSCAAPMIRRPGAATLLTAARSRPRSIGSRRRMPRSPRCVSTIRCSPGPIQRRRRFRRGPQSAVAGSVGGARVEPALAAATNSADPVQFERQGYFVRDPDSTADRLVFNRTVGLRDTFAKEVGGKTIDLAAGPDAPGGALRMSDWGWGRGGSRGRAQTWPDGPRGAGAPWRGRASPISAVPSPNACANGP